MEVYEYAQRARITIDKVIQVQVSSRENSLIRRIDELMEMLEDGDTLIVTEISRLGRSTTEIIQLINKMLDRKVRVVSIKQGIDLNTHDMSSKIIVTMFSLLAELERDLISIRTKEALAVKKSKGVKLGKPRGVMVRENWTKIH